MSFADYKSQKTMQNSAPNTAKPNLLNAGKHLNKPKHKTKTIYNYISVNTTAKKKKNKNKINTQTNTLLAKLQ